MKPHMNASGNISSLPVATSDNDVTFGTYHSLGTSTVAPVAVISRLQILQGTVVATGIVGAVANSFVFCLLADHECRKRESVNPLILNQVFLDLFSCISVIITYGMKIKEFYLTGVWSYIYCAGILNEMLLWLFVFGSSSSIIIIAVERYMNIVHPVLQKKYFRKWMIFLAIALCFTNGVLVSTPTTFVSTFIYLGQCGWHTPLPNITSVVAYNDTISFH